VCALYALSVAKYWSNSQFIYIKSNGILLI